LRCGELGLGSTACLAEWYNVENPVRDEISDWRRNLKRLLKREFPLHSLHLAESISTGGLKMSPKMLQARYLGSGQKRVHTGDPKSLPVWL
jgi:hypothetical protein